MIYGNIWQYINFSVKLSEKLLVWTSVRGNRMLTKQRVFSLIDKTPVFVIIIYSILVLLALILVLQTNAIISQIGQNALVGLITIIITFFMTKFWWEYDKWKKWKIIRTKVMQELNDELSSLLTDIRLICDLSSIIVSQEELSTEEIIRKDNQQTVENLRSSVQNENLKISPDWEKHLLEGQFGDLFKRRETFLNQFQLKYMDFLDANVIISLIDIQKALHRVDQDIRIRNKRIANQWQMFDTDESLITRIEKNLAIITKSINELLERKIIQYLA
jgi:hypothetical protein